MGELKTLLAQANRKIAALSKRLQVVGLSCSSSSSQSDLDEDLTATLDEAEEAENVRSALGEAKNEAASLKGKVFALEEELEAERTRCLLFDLTHNN